MPTNLDLNCYLVSEFVSTTWIKQSAWLTIRRRCDILIYSAWQGLTLKMLSKMVADNIHFIIIIIIIIIIQRK